jgi:hypothetical protein
MAGFEVVVRPAVFPNIRPTPSRSLPPSSSDPTKGVCVIKGSSGKTVDLPYSWSVSTSNTRPQETQRRVDEVRIYQQDDNGTVNRNNFVDMHVANKIWTVDPSVGSIQGNVFVPNQGGKVTTKTDYARVEETNNVEIRNKDIIKKNPNARE